MSNTYSKRQVSSKKKEPQSHTPLRPENRQSLAYRNSKSGLKPQLLVEDRLYSYLSTYESKRAQLAKKLQMSETKELKPPKIDEVSEVIVANMPRVHKVEERLILKGEKAKKAKERKVKEVEALVKKTAKPGILKSSRVLAQLKNGSEDVVTRLYKYQKEHEKRKKELRDKAIERENCSFTPQVNSEVNKGILAIPELKNRIKTRAKFESKNCTFKPKISKNSSRIAERLEPSQSRLLSPKGSQQIQTDEYPFAPIINPHIDPNKRMSVLTKISELPRWETLYGLGEKRKAELEEKRRKLREEQEQKEKVENTYHPKICPYTPAEKAPTEKASTEKLQERTTAWEKTKATKLQEKKEKQEKQQLETCTFKPTLVAEKGNEILVISDLNAESIKSVDQYIEKHKSHREQKEEDRRKAALYVGSGNLWTKKTITVPKPPNFVFNPRVERENRPVPDQGGYVRKTYPKSELQKRNMRQNKEIAAMAEGRLLPIAENLEFSEAVSSLHQDLMSVDIENPNFE